MVSVASLLLSVVVVVAVIVVVAVAVVVVVASATIDFSPMHSKSICPLEIIANFESLSKK